MPVRSLRLSGRLPGERSSLEIAVTRAAGAGTSGSRYHATGANQNPLGGEGESW
jgi:hypothetical protein